jgi:hypothetical protein
MNTSLRVASATVWFILFAPLSWAGTEGSASTFYGVFAGSTSPPDSGYNTFLGQYAGHNNTTGIQNTFVGAGAGINSNGDNNTFTGFQAGYFNTTGTENTAVGLNAGLDNTTGSGNTSLGALAGLSNTGSNNTFVGRRAGYHNTAGIENTYLGWQAAYHNDTGNYNTVVGTKAGYQNFTGDGNTHLGYGSGYNNASGSNNVFVGVNAGYSETGSRKLYIDTCYNDATCTSPLIYGEFDNHLLNINGVTNVAANNVAKSQMHFSLANADSGGFLTSVLPNNFFVSSGARYDTGNWVQLSADGNAVMAGSGGVGYRIFTHTGTAVGNTFNDPTLRLQIDYSGQFGINTAPVAGHEIHTSTGAYLAGGTWTDASSRAYKDNIHELTADAALSALAALNPVTFTYKTDAQWQHVGFIAEDVPDLLASPDRKGLSPMDVVALLTKVVQEQKEQLGVQDQKLQAERARSDSMEERLQMLAAEVARLQGRVPR